MSRSEGGEKLFVYGTLRSGFPNHQRLARDGVVLVGRASIQALLYDLGAYPGAMPSRSRARVQGELYSLPQESILTELDTFEGFDPAIPEKSLYVRQRVQARLANGEIHLAWVYFLARRPRSAKRIHGGDYAEHRNA